MMVYKWLCYEFAVLPHLGVVGTSQSGVVLSSVKFYGSLTPVKCSSNKYILPHDLLLFYQGSSS